MILLSEALVSLMDDDQVKQRFGTYDTAHQDLGRHIVMELQKRMQNTGLEQTIVAKNLGNELRAASPNAADLILTRNLGYGAVRALLDGANAVLVTCSPGSTLRTIPLSELCERGRDPTIRSVNTTQLDYQVSQSYMIRLTSDDLANATIVNRLAATANVSMIDFLERFRPVAWRASARVIASLSLPHPIGSGTILLNSNSLDSLQAVSSASNSHNAVPKSTTVESLNRLMPASSASDPATKF